MDKRFFLALLLTAIVIVAPPLLFQRSGARRATSGVDSSRTPPRADTANGQTAAAGTRAPAPQSAQVSDVAAQSASLGPSPIETTTVQTRLAHYRFSSRGGVPISVVLDSYPSKRPGAANSASQLLPANTALAHFRLALGADTIALDTISLRGQTSSSGTTTPSIVYTGAVAGRPLTLTYSVVADSFLLRVAANVVGAPAGSALLLGLPRTLQSNEPDTLDDIRHLAVSYRLKSGDIESVAFSKLDSAEIRAESRPTQWVATRNKYFLVAYRVASNTPFSAVQLQGGPRSGKVANSITAGVTLPLSPDGRAAFDIYAGNSHAARAVPIAAGSTVITRHGLQLLAQPAGSGAPRVGRLVVPGPRNTSELDPGLARWAADHGLDIALPQATQAAGEFSFDPLLRDLAAHADKATARSTAKNTEYPTAHLQLAGSAWPWRPTVLAALTIAAAIGAGFLPAAARRHRP